MTRAVASPVEITCAAAVHGVLRDANGPMSVRQIAESPGLSGWTEAAVWYSVRRLEADRLVVVSGVRSSCGGPMFQLPPIAFNPPRSA